MDRFLEMQAFVAVVDAGSFVRAADALGRIEGGGVPARLPTWSRGSACGCCIARRAGCR